MDRLAAITLFNRVVETGSFSAAGRHENLAPSSVSRRIIELEAWLGVTLFHRTTRRLNLTAPGRAFHERTRSILLDLEEARTVVSKLEDKPSGLVRVSVPASFERHMVVASALFQSRWPEVSFGLTSTDLKVDLVAEGFDLAIRAGNLKDSTLRVSKLAEVKRRLCGSPGYLDGAPVLAKPTDLEAHQCLVLGRESGDARWAFKKARTVDEVKVSGAFTANSGNMLVAAARLGRGLMLSPEWIVGPYLASGELVDVLPAYTPYPSNSTLYLVHPYQRFMPPRVRMFIEFLKAHFGNDYNWTVDPAQQGEALTAR